MEEDKLKYLTQKETRICGEQKWWGWCDGEEVIESNRTKAVSAKRSRTPEGHDEEVFQLIQW